MVKGLKKSVCLLSFQWVTYLPMLRLFYYTRQ